MASPTDKSTRTFRCRDVFWEVFEQMSQELECSVDYLVNDAMRQYARNRGYLDRTGASVHASALPSSLAAGASGQGSLPAGRNVDGRHGTQPRSVAAAMAPGQSAARSFPAPPGRRRAPSAGRPSAGPRAGSLASPSIGSGAGYAPHGGFSAAPARRPQLALTFQGQHYPVNSDEFVIGRAAKTSDLAIRDGNISRRHAAIVFENGAYYIKDLGSTNGIEVGGHRVETHRISDGDIVYVCEYELRFALRA